MAAFSINNNVTSGELGMVILSALLQIYICFAYGVLVRLMILIEPGFVMCISVGRSTYRIDVLIYCNGFKYLFIIY